MDRREYEAIPGRWDASASQDRQALSVSRASRDRLAHKARQDVRAAPVSPDSRVPPDSRAHLDFSEQPALSAFLDFPVLRVFPVKTVCPVPPDSLDSPEIPDCRVLVVFRDHPDFPVAQGPPEVSVQRE